MTRDAAWLTLIGLGVYHGVNPAMGWLFAVSRGMQERRRAAVWRSLLPIAIGHEMSIALVAVVVLLLAAVLEPAVLHVGAAGILLAFGLFRFARPRAHFRWTSMRVSDRELTLWSFLMSTAHGAGLMVAPVLIGLQGHLATTHMRADHRADLAMVTDLSIPQSAVGIALHVGTMLVVMGAIAVVVYERVGLRVLSRAWLNTDRLWGGALVHAAARTRVS
jgi:hypothetical protein